MSWCSILGHWLVNIDTKNMVANCKRCKKKFDISYDMYSGDTIIIGEQE